MDETLGCGFRESDGGSPEFGFGGLFVASGNGFVDLSYHSTDGGFGRACAGAPEQRLSMTFFCRRMIGQRGSSEVDSGGS